MGILHPISLKLKSKQLWNFRTFKFKSTNILKNQSKLYIASEKILNQTLGQLKKNSKRLNLYQFLFSKPVFKESCNEIQILIYWWYKQKKNLFIKQKKGSKYKVQTRLNPAFRNLGKNLYFKLNDNKIKKPVSKENKSQIYIKPINHLSINKNSNKKNMVIKNTIALPKDQILKQIQINISKYLKLLNNKTALKLNKYNLINTQKISNTNSKYVKASFSTIGVEKSSLLAPLNKNKEVIPAIMDLGKTTGGNLTPLAAHFKQTKHYPPILFKNTIKKLSENELKILFGKKVKFKLIKIKNPIYNSYILAQYILMKLKYHSIRFVWRNLYKRKKKFYVSKFKNKKIKPAKLIINKDNLNHRISTVKEIIKQRNSQKNLGQISPIRSFDQLNNKIGDMNHLFQLNLPLGKKPQFSDIKSLKISHQIESAFEKLDNHDKIKQHYTILKAISNFQNYHYYLKIPTINPSLSYFKWYNMTNSTLDKLGDNTQNFISTELESDLSKSDFSKSDKLNNNFIISWDKLVKQNSSNLIINGVISKITGIKIKLNGRFTRRKGASRTKTKTLQKGGKFYFNSESSLIDYAILKNKTKNGSMGIKVYISSQLDINKLQYDKPVKL